MKNILNLIAKIIVLFILYFIISVVLKMGFMAILSWYNNSMYDGFSVVEEFIKVMLLIISYGLCDFVSMILSIFIVDRKNTINNKVLFWTYIVIFVLINILMFKPIYINYYQMFDGNSIYLIITNIVMLIINIVLLKLKINKREKLLKL